MWQFDILTNKFVPGSLPANGKITACYTRLSQEDELDGDSGSILNQRDFLWKHCTENHFENIRFFSDDGYTGVNFERPSFAEMMKLVEQGYISTIIVKDHSRLGRNRLMVGLLMEQFTEDYNVRYIAVTDGIDSDKGFDDMVAVRELFNEFYPRDISKKIRAVVANKGNSGQRLCTQIPYGYIGDKSGWEIDPVAADVVRRIFSLCISGLGPTQIAKLLRAEQVLTPTAYYISVGRSTPHPTPADPYKWDTGSVVAILQHKEYTGCTVNFKMTKKSYKSKKIIPIPPEQRKEFSDTHPAIVDLETWERVQELRKHKRRRSKSGRQGLFSGLVYCADCGEKLYFNTCDKLVNNGQEHYTCSNYKSNTGTCSAHFIREAVLKSLILEHLRQTLWIVRTHENEFVQAVMSKNMADQKKELAQKRRELTQAERRIADLDFLFQRIYEDNVNCKLSDERFAKLSQSYEDEQRTLKDRVTALRGEVEQEQQQAVNVGQFIALVKRYTEVEELTPAILNEFISRVVVYAPDRSSGKRTQRIDIQYNFIGEIPDTLANLKTA
ncbi:MAG: DUF4368 domain-containing protein [Oscillospiraceae bacterium]|jgi:site-specific DNA recombinase|nr:DUF4368 domain-containing protein [Oscillospiraceae bacterium]